MQKYALCNVKNLILLLLCSGGGGPSGPRRYSRDYNRGYDRGYDRGGYDRGGYDRYDDRDYYRSYRWLLKDISGYFILIVSYLGLLFFILSPSDTDKNDKRSLFL